MADDPNPTLRVQFQDAIPLLDKDIRGLHNLASHSTASADLRGAYTDKFTKLEHARDLILQGIATIDALLRILNELEGVGWPDFPKEELPNSLFAELQEEVSDIHAAADVFEAPQMASQLKVSLGEATNKT